MENIDKIIKRIDNLNDIDDSTIESIIDEIHNIRDESERNNLYSLFLKRVKRYMITFFDNYSAEEIDKKVNTIISNLTSSLHFDEQILKDTKFSTEEIIGSNVFEIEKNEEVEKYITKINNIVNLDEKECAEFVVEISSKFNKEDTSILLDTLGNKYDNLIFNETLSKSGEERKKFINEFYSNVDKHVNFLKNSNIVTDVLNKDLGNDTKKEIDKINEITNSIFSKLDQNNNINEYHSLSEEELENKLSELSKERTLTKDKKKLKQLDKDISTLYTLLHEKRLLDSYSSYTDEELVELINKNINEIKELNDNINSKKGVYYKFDINELNLLIKENESKLLDIDSEVRKELSNKLQLSYSGLKPEQIKEIREEVKNRVNNHNDKLEKEIKNIKKEIESRNNNSNDDDYDKLIEENNKLLDEKNKDLISVLNLRTKDKYKYYSYNDLKEIYEKDKSNDEIYNELLNRESNLTDEEKEIYGNLMDIKEAYYNILNDTVNKFNNDIDTENIKNYINNHELINILKNYNNSEKLINELNIEVLNKLRKIKNKIKIEKKEHNKKIWLKALSGAIGFATGFGLASIPGYNVIGGAISTTKLAVTVVNVWTKKYPEGKVAKFKNNQIEKFETKCPNISKKVKAMKEKLNKEPIKWFVNGMAIGYLAGNLYEQIAGETVFEQLKDAFSKGDVIPENSVTVVDPIPEVPTVPEIDPSEIFLDKGEVVNISKLPQGFISSDSTTPVNVIQKVGEAVEFDRAVALPDGKVMWHFKQLNGKGYAWFEAEKIQELLAKTSKVAGKVATKSL